LPDYTPPLFGEGCETMRRPRGALF
jgi:hypothetical protein